MASESNYYHKLYIAQSPAGLHKIGCSRTPKRRTQELANALGCDVALMHTRVIKRDGMRREAAVHRKLAEFNVFGEWFAVSLEQARAAVRSA